MYKRAEVVAPGEPFRMVEGEVPSPKPGCVRVRLAYSGVCHSDVHLCDDQLGFCHTYGADKYKGMVLGHEIAGYVDTAGSGVDLEAYGLKPGDPVMVYPWVGCQECVVCKAGYTNMCPSPEGRGSHIGCGPFAEGGYQSHVITKPKYLVKVPDGVAMDLACMLPCSAGTAFSALQKLEPAIKFGQTTAGKARVLIVGAGGLGLWAIQLAKVMYGADNVYVIAADIGQSKLDLAKAYGADETVLWDPQASAETNAQATVSGGPVNGAIDFCATQATATTAVSCLNVNGALVFVGLRGGTFSADFYHIVLGNVSVYGNCIFTMKQFHQLIQLVHQHKLTYPSLSYFKLDEAYDVIQKLKQGRIDGRALIKH